MSEDTGKPLSSDPRGELEVALTAERLAEPVVKTEDGREFAILPPDYRLQDVTSKYRLPPRIIQGVTVDDAQSLITYANRFSDTGSVLIADIDKLAIAAHLDWHMHNDASEDLGPLAPRACSHRAILQLRESEEFKRWNGMQGELLKQMEFAEFLDENASDIVDPEPSVMIEIARDLEATQGVSFKSSTRLQTGERSLHYETETHTKGDIKVPTQFTLEIPLFAGEEPVPITASFRFRPRPDGLMLGFVWRRVEYRRQAEFQLIANRVSEATGLPVAFGRTGHQ